MRSFRFLFFLLPVLATDQLQAQSVLDQYVKQAIDSNIVLREKSIAYDQAVLALQNARSYFQPSVNLNGSYTTGEGGRYIALPLGDMLNPVYSTLNQLTNSNSFPQLENVEQSFFPNNMYDVHVRTTLPVVNTDIWYAKSISEKQAAIKQEEISLYKRELVRDVKLAYYNYISATEAVKIYTEALDLAGQNIKVTQSLITNGKAVQAQALRAESDKAQVNAQLEQARNQQQTAEAYFNFLVNRPLHTSISTENISLQATTLSAIVYDSAQIAKREELKMLQQGIQLRQTASRMSHSYMIPKVSLFLDLGSQSESWAFDDKSRYYLFGVQLDMPLYNGLRNQRNYRSSQLDVKQASLQFQNTQQQLQLAADIARNDLISAIAKWKAAGEQQKAAASYYRLISNGYAQGINPLIELIDARNQLTAADVQLNVCLSQALQAKARLERETAATTY